MFHAWTYTVYTDSQTQTCCTQPKRDKYAGSVAGSGYGYGKVYQPGVVGWHLLLCVPLPPSAAEEGSSQRLTWWGRMFPQPSPNRGCGHAQRPVEEILSTPWPLHLVGVSRDAAPPPSPTKATHTDTYSTCVPHVQSPAQGKPWNLVRFYVPTNYFLLFHTHCCRSIVSHFVNFFKSFLISGFNLILYNLKSFQHLNYCWDTL